MGFNDALSSMRECIRTALDEVASPRSSPSSKTKALRNLEEQLAKACFITTNDSERKDAFLALQFTFECNIPSHLLPWVMLSTLRLEGLTSKSLSEEELLSETEELLSQLNLSLSLIQGVVLNHEPSKEYLGRKCSLEILLDLLLASRHLPTQLDTAAESAFKPTRSSPPHLTSTILDTLLCVLVDSPIALRTFEKASGVQAVVKILKRAGTPREVRMKCLEFLYFYLLDETPSSSDGSSSFTPVLLNSPQPTPPPTAPVTPIRPAKPYFSGVTPLRPKSCYGSSTYSFSSSSSLGGFSFSDLANSASSSSSKSSPSSSVGSIPKSVTKSLRSASGGSTKSFSSASSDASSSTAASSVQCTPSLMKESGSVPPPVFIPPDLEKKRSPVKAQRVVTPQNQTKNAISPPNTPPLQASDSANKIFPFQPRSLMMLRKEVDYVPQSPKKVLAVGVGRPPLANMGAVTPAAVPIGMEGSRRGHRKSLSASMLGSGIPPPILQRKKSDGERTRRTITTLRGLGGARSKVGVKEERQGSREKDNEGGKETFWKTTEQKKALLGTMLGNVDALVEGVRKAGIWGLG